MKVKAVVSFGGRDLSMAVGEEREISDKAVLSDLVRAGFVKELPVMPKPKKEVEVKTKAKS